MPRYRPPRSRAARATMARSPTRRRRSARPISTRCRCRHGTSSTSSATAARGSRRTDCFRGTWRPRAAAPIGCNWCAKPIFGRRYVQRSPDARRRELRRLKSEVRPDHIWFADDIFGLTAPWIESFASEVAARNARTPFMIQSRADLMQPPVVAALAAAGAEEVWLGVESGSQTILDAMDKEHHRRRGARGDACAEGRGDQGLLVPAARISVGAMGRHPADARSRSRRTARRYRRVGRVSAAGDEVPHSGASAARLAEELARHGRSRDAVSRARTRRRSTAFSATRCTTRCAPGKRTMRGGPRWRATRDDSVLPSRSSPRLTDL